MAVNVTQLAGAQIACACGRTHSVPIKNIYTGCGALDGLAHVLREDFSGAKAFVVGDTNTMPLAHGRVLAMLEAAGCKSESRTYHSDTHLVLTQDLIGRMLLDMPQDTQILIAIGSGTMGDLTRVISARCRIPYIIIGTAPSMDGYASPVSSVVRDGGKFSQRFDHVPHTIIADTELLKTAPDNMLAAGVGDILGKYVALNDWKLAQRETGEYFCDYLAELINDAVGRCVANIDGVKRRDGAALQDMAEALILSGVAICMHGVSRPASGCEHQIAHCWEVALLGGPGESPLHGNLVGFGTLVACRLYELAAEVYDLEFPFYLPKPAEISTIIDEMGGYSSLKTLGITREMFYDSFFHAISGTSGRYTLIAFLQEKGVLEQYAQALTDEFFD